MQGHSIIFKYYLNHLKNFKLRITDKSYYANKNPDMQFIVKSNLNKIRGRNNYFNLLVTQILEHTGVYLSAYDLGIVIVGQQTIAYGREQPEGFFFAAIQEQHACHYVHGLTVANLWIVDRIG